jgi:phosphodiesterase/alkaline phosphatase D-like protein
VWSGVSASVSLALLSGRGLFAAQSFGDNPFTLGVASGDPTPDGIVLWTRLAPDPADPTSLGRRTIPVRWRVATDAAMRRVVARGTAAAVADLAHSVHVEVQGLAPRRDYFFQFDVRNEESVVGHLTGDWHSTFVNDLKLDFKDPNASVVATEFVTPAITSGGDGTPYGPYYAPMIPFNPHIEYYEGDRRGYFKATVTPRQMRLDLRFVTSVENPAGDGYSEASWIVQDGVPGAEIA